MLPIRNCKISNPLILTLTVADLYNLIFILRLLTILRHDDKNKFNHYCTKCELSSEKRLQKILIFYFF